MLEILNDAYFEETMQWARAQGLAKQLQGKLDYLSTYSGRDGIVCKLGRDFAPHSFQFTMFREGKYWFNGGLIYQGPEQPANGSAPSFTVSLAKGTAWTGKEI